MFRYLKRKVDACLRFRSIRMQFHSRSVFQRSAMNEFNEIDVSRIVAHFHTPSIVVSPAFAIDLNDVVDTLSSVWMSLRNWAPVTFRSINVDQLSVSFVKFRHLGQAGSYVPE